MKIMGVLNVTPDSFSDGGLWYDPAAATKQGLKLWADGADIVDVGAESTRPGSTRISAEEEWRRLEPVLRSLVDSGVYVSVDTVHSSTAARSVNAGAQMINDISGGSFDPEMNRTVADANVSYVIQHWRGFPGSAGLNEHYENPVVDTLNETLHQVREAVKAGVDPTKIIIDPGLGFALTAEQSWQIVDNLKTWVNEGYPVLVGASRKRFIKQKFPGSVERGTRLVTGECAAAGVWAVRVHDVAGNRAVLARRSGT